MVSGFARGRRTRLPETPHFSLLLAAAGQEDHGTGLLVHTDRHRPATAETPLPATLRVTFNNAVHSDQTTLTSAGAIGKYQSEEVTLNPSQPARTLRALSERR